MTRGPRGGCPAAGGNGRRRDRGSASIFVLAVGLFVLTAALAGAAVGSARVARHVARNAADLGALAGAARAIEGTGVACAEAGRYVAANRARMTSCEVTGLEVVVRTEVSMTSLPGTATAAARAGPVAYSGGGV
ncbi:Rv3654c family TadE-like protein [Actinoplanes sp. NPDC051851]|uniref:Rv3654c family TadE-like protein n=1 Tax=Actinoplanes sp. NPDC051851 TaxID=3154753 RepID=UPI00344778AB